MIASSLRVVNFKSYGSVGLEIETFRPLSLIIGRNNIGKSSILDAIQSLCASSEVNRSHFHKGNVSSFIVTGTVGEKPAASVYTPGTSGGWVGGDYWKIVGKPLSESRMSVELSAKEPPRFVELYPNEELLSRSVHDNYGRKQLVVEHEKFAESLNLIAQRITNPFAGKKFVRLAAERDIQPEPRQGSLSIGPSGAGLTNVITQVISLAKYDSSLVEREMLGVLNDILYPDIVIGAIRVQELDSGHWELFLEEKGKGTISLSNSGSGLKTVILTVALLFLMPKLGLQADSNIIYMLEELENNLHPALQRRLLGFVSEHMNHENRISLITTHSSALIDMFSNVENAQVIHVTGSSGEAVAKVVDTHVSRCGILDDLDVRASDILQSNGVIWVEGPSDRVYLNRWIDLISEGALKEGIHYQCVFYGGRLLSHLTASVSDGARSPEGIEILRVARNAIVVIDSDQSAVGDNINATKRRIVSEIEGVGGLSWVTDGREVENYIPETVWARMDSRLSRGIGEHEEIEGYLASLLPDIDARRLIKSKAALSEKVVESWRVEDLEPKSALYQRLLGVRAAIFKWNGMV